MTQPAKSQEPSMEEILASIRRIIADDDAAKTPPPAPEPVRPAPRPVAPPRAFAPPPPPEPVEAPEPELHAEFDAGPSGDEDVEDNASEILDLTESMEAPSFSQPAPAPTPQFRKIEAFSDVSFDEAEQKPVMQRAEAPVAHITRDAGGQGQRYSRRSRTVSRRGAKANSRSFSDDIFASRPDFGLK